VGEITIIDHIMWNPDHIRLMFSLKWSPVASKRLKQRKTMIPPETIEPETKERHNAHVLPVSHRT